MREPPTDCPSELDGATVVQFASLSGIAHLARAQSYLDGELAPQPEALAVARYAGESDVYLFECSAEWLVNAAGHYASAAAAVAAAEADYPGVVSRWVLVAPNPPSK